MLLLYSEVVGKYVGFTPSVCLYVRPPVRLACRVRSVTPTVPNGFFPHLTQMITSMRGCVVYNNLSPWPISSRPFKHDFKACKVLNRFFPIWHRQSLACEGVLYTMTFDLDQYLQSHSAVSLQWNVKICHILSCPLNSMYSSGSIRCIFRNDH